MKKFHHLTLILAATAVIAATPDANAALKKKKTTATAPTEQQVPAQDIAAVIDGQWTIQSLGSTKIELDEDVPYIAFVLADNAFYAFNGCNILNGVFTISDSNKITFHNILTTMKYCQDTPFDTKVNAVLQEENTVTAKFDEIGGEKYLYLADSTGHTVMTLRRHAMDFLNGNWRISEINDEKFGDDMTIFIDIDELKVHGNTGCNYFNGSIFIDPNEANAISFSQMGVTRRMCPNVDQERKMLVALEEVTIAIEGDNDTALLTDQSGRTVIKLVKAPMQNND